MATRLRGQALLRNPHLNRYTAFTEAEREAYALTGLLPEAIEDGANQVRRVMGHIERLQSDLDRYIFLSTLRDNNETLFYRVLASDLARFLPIVYTPTVGDACLEFSHISAPPAGLYLSIARKGRVRETLRHWPERGVRFIVVTSGERILGLGDLGANGMGIPIGKLALYTACAGVPPQTTIPITIDFGTNNETLLADPLYLGLRQPRPPIEIVDEFVEEFVTAVEAEFPGCCIQFEDWARADAFRLLARYRDRVCCFNDDIQGSAAAALAGILSALRITGGKLADQKVLLLGAGSAAVGILDLLTEAIASEGVSPERAREQIWLFNRNGLIESTRTDLLEFQRPYAHRHEPSRDFLSTIESIKPTILVGACTVAKAFNREVIQAMARINPRPIIFALSNPTSRSECTAEEAYKWSDGRAVFASGSPFDPVLYRERKFIPGQCNNLYIFPAMGLAVYATRASRVTDQMFIAAARAVADLVTRTELDAGLIYPPLSAIPATEMRVAERIAEVIFASGLARVEAPGELRSFIESHVYRPEYAAVN